MGEIEFGKCEVCKKEAQLQRTYFHYDIKCECHSPQHFEVVCHCANCVPFEPEMTKITIKTKELNNLMQFNYVLQFCEKCLQMTNHLHGKCQKCKNKTE